MSRNIFFPAIPVCFLAFGLVFVSCGGKKLSGTWEASESPVSIGQVIEFSGNNFTARNQDGSQREDEYGTGTYSIIADSDQIEFTLSSGRKLMYSFYRPKNAIIIEGRVYKPKK
jgi:hypothetical protein